MSYNSDIDQLIRQATQQGWRHQKTTRGHHQFYAPNKHDIITFAGTPGDVRGFTNSVAQMKKCGFVDYGGGPATLGDLLLAKPAEAPPPEEPVQATTYAGLTDLIRGYMLAHPNEQVELSTLVSHVQLKRPGTKREATAIAIAPLVKRGEFRRIGMGTYMYTDTSKLPEAPKTNGVHPPAVVEPPPPPPEPVVPASVEAAQVEDDIAELDAALVALAKIETVVRRNRAVMVQLKELKDMLGKFGG